MERLISGRNGSFQEDTQVVVIIYYEQMLHNLRDIQIKIVSM